MADGHGEAQAFLRVHGDCEESASEEAAVGLDEVERGSSGRYEFGALDLATGCSSGTSNSAKQMKVNVRVTNAFCKRLDAT